jgi:Dimerisation domain
MIKGYWVSQIVGTLAQLEIADHLADGPLDCNVLADGIGCEPKATSRLLLASVDVGLVSLTAPGHWLPWTGLMMSVVRGRPEMACREARRRI